MADEKRKGDCIEGGPSQDGVDRRGFLKCMAWAGTGLVWTLSGGIPTSRLFGATGHEAHHGDNGFSFVQVSDSHIGFNKGANPDVTGTFQAAIDKINSLPAAPDLIIHTGDLSQISKPGEFDTVDQVLRGAKAKQVFYVPGEHDFAVDDGQQFLQRYGKGTKGAGWQSFDHKGVHFIGLVNVANLKAGGMGSLGGDQLEWVEDDVKGLSASTPIVVFAHIPLWAVYPEWGWGTQDSAQALGYLIFFSSIRRHTRFDCDWSSDVCSSDLSPRTSPTRSRTRAALPRRASWPTPIPTGLRLRWEWPGDCRSRLPCAPGWEAGPSSRPCWCGPSSAACRHKAAWRSFRAPISPPEPSGASGASCLSW